MTQKARGARGSTALGKITRDTGSGSDFFHSGDETDVRAADGTLGTGHGKGRFGGAAAAILLRAIEVDALAAIEADFLGDGLVAGNFLGAGFDHAALTALGVALDKDFLGNEVVFAGLDLAGFDAVASRLGWVAEHRTAGGEAEGNGHEGNNHKQIFHESINYWLGLERASRITCNSMKLGQMRWWQWRWW